MPMFLGIRKDFPEQANEDCSTGQLLRLLLVHLKLSSVSQHGGTPQEIEVECEPESFGMTWYGKSHCLFSPLMWV